VHIEKTYTYSKGTRCNEWYSQSLNKFLPKTRCELMVTTTLSTSLSEEDKFSIEFVYVCVKMRGE